MNSGFTGSSQLLAILDEIERSRPELSLPEVARLALIVVNNFETKTAKQIEHAICDSENRQAAVDEQLSAVVDDLENLASSSPAEFHPEQIWTLLRAIRVQKKALDLYDC